MLLYGFTQSPDLLRKRLSKYVTKTVPSAFVVDETWNVFDWLIYTSFDNFLANYRVLRTDVFTNKCVVVCDSHHLLSNIEGLVVINDSPITRNKKLLNLRVNDTYVDDLIDQVVAGSLLNKLMTYVYEIQKNFVQKSVKNTCINWLFNQHLDLAKQLANVRQIPLSVKSNIQQHLLSKTVLPYRQAFLDLSNAVPIDVVCAKYKIDIFEVNYCTAIYKDILKRAT